MDSFGHNLVVAMAGRKFNIYDIRMMERPKQERESSLRFMTGAVACMLNGEGTSGFASSARVVFLTHHCSWAVVHVGYAAASIEGRVAVEYFDPSPTAQAKKYAFKCHRQGIDGVDHVWPVNALAFHPV
jgi:cell cycle arrest protein BUB3